MEFCPAAECPTFERFLHRIMGGNAELVRFLQKCIGYCLTGAVTEKVFFIFLGDGDNGKTTLLEAVRFVLGEYAGQIPIASLLKKNENGIPLTGEPRSTGTSKSKSGGKRT
jgi:putative DNA primase/helicase